MGKEKEHLLKQTRDKYPKGSIYLNMATGKQVISSGKFKYCDESHLSDHIYDEVNKDIVWCKNDNIWADII